MTALAATYGLTADQGATFNQVIVWRDPNNNPVNLIGYTARMYINDIRTSSVSSSVIETLTTENGSIVLEPSTGSITLTLSAAETSAMPAGKHSYYLELESDGGEVDRLLAGYFVVRSEVTR